MDPALSSSLGKKVLLPALKILQKTFQTWGICQGYARVYILVLKPYIFLSSPGSSSNNTAICQYFLCIHPFPQCFYSPPDEYILLFYFLLSSLLSTSFFSVSFFSHFFLFFTISSLFLSLFQIVSHKQPLTLGSVSLKGALKCKFLRQNALSWILLLKDSRKRVLCLVLIS